MAKDPKHMVGYGKPPIHSQFKPGKSGNPKGRPKGQPTVEQLMTAELATFVKVKKGEVVMSMPKKDILIRKAVDMAISGHLAAMRLVLALTGQAELSSNLMAHDEPPLTAQELAAIAMFIEIESSGDPS